MLKKISLAFLGVTTLAFTAHAFTTSQSDAVDLGKASAAVEYVANNTTVLSTGDFDGRSDHITTGKVKLEKTSTGYQLSFAADFSLDGAPDPVVALGNGETFNVANKLGTLKNKTGRQVYQLPAGFTPGQFSEVYVWCEKFSVPLGVAKLNAA
jgi:hypothetical protein